ncbi:MAG: cytidylyltransferase domain-containing protein [Candidatus Cyclobacteriaceae bacterium M2_1C_046]
MKILITICARGGSKGIPGKNIKPLNGIPLIAYSIRVGLEFAKKYNADFALSTDNDTIKEVAASHGLNTDYTRPTFLASDTAGKIDAINDLLVYQEKKNDCRYDFIIDMDVTSPFRTVEDIEEAFQSLRENHEAKNIFSVSPASRNPYFNMVEKKDSCYVNLVNGGNQFKSRQQAPVVYDMNASFYIFRRIFFDENHPISITDKSMAYVVPHICFDLDEPHDFIIMEIMIRENLLDFKI